MITELQIDANLSVSDLHYLYLALGIRINGRGSQCHLVAKSGVQEFFLMYLLMYLHRGILESLRN